MAKKKNIFNSNVMDMIEDIDDSENSIKESFRQDLLKLFKKYPSITGPFSKHNGVVLLVDMIIKLVNGIVNGYETLDKKKTKEVDKMPTWIDD